MATIESGITIGPGITFSPPYTIKSATLVYDLDAANFVGTPATGNVDATGTYSITVSNSSGRLTWNSVNGGVFRFTGTGTTTTDYIYGGPNYVTGQSYTAFMAYKLATSANGRLLNTQSEATKDWLMGSYSSGSNYMNVFYPNGTVNLSSDVADTAWHFVWGSFDSALTRANVYIATNTAPVGTYKTATNAGFGGFNQLRLFSRASGSEVQTADVAFVKVWNGVLSINDIQFLHSQYVTRMGY